MNGSSFFFFSFFLLQYERLIGTSVIFISLVHANLVRVLISFDLFFSRHATRSIGIGANESDSRTMRKICHSVYFSNRISYSFIS